MRQRKTQYRIKRKKGWLQKVELALTRLCCLRDPKQTVLSLIGAGGSQPVGHKVAHLLGSLLQAGQIDILCPSTIPIVILVVSLIIGVPIDIVCN